MTIYGHILVLKDIIDVSDGFKTCAYFTTDEVEDVQNNIFLHWNVKLTVTVFLSLFRGGGCIILLCLLQCVNKDIILSYIF